MNLLRPSSSNGSSTAGESGESGESGDLDSAELRDIQSIINKPCTAAELESAIEKCSSAVLESETMSSNRKWFVRFLIELRYKLAELQFGESVASSGPSASFVLFSGHHFYLQTDKFLRNLQCDQCSGIIWCYFQAYYKCADCGFCCHNLPDELAKTNVCPHTILTESGQFSMEICPEIGISSQNYLCAGCGSEFGFIDCARTAPKLCDYDGLYYCRACHTDERSLIPSRVIHNWDFDLYPVCRKNAQLLKLLANRPVLNIDKFHSDSPHIVADLKLVRELRSKLASMRMYLSTCKNDQSQQLLKIADGRPHLIESAMNFSLSDLVDWKNGVLVADLTSWIGRFSQHIRTDCDICKQRGFYCEICVPEEILFRFDDNVLVCDQCDWIYHRACFQKRNRICPKCQRRKKRTAVDEP